MKALYKYPQAPFPYSRLVEENKRRTAQEPEFELLDTGVFDQDRYFDVFVEYAKASPDDILIRIRVVNRGPEPAPVHLLPTLWFRNTWSWNGGPRPSLQDDNANGFFSVGIEHPQLGRMRWIGEAPEELLFTENDTNYAKLFGLSGARAYVKDAFHRYLIDGERGAIHPKRRGTKAAAHYRKVLAPGESWSVKGRLLSGNVPADPLGKAFEKMFETRRLEADAFYQAVAPEVQDAESRAIQRQAFAGLLWSKQFYHYIVQDWLNGDPAQPPPPAARRTGRNRDWTHLHADDILSMPDTWEYPWFAAWDLAFQSLPLAMIDPEFAKKQLLVLTREWYLHPNGQVPSYEWAFDDVNPPVQAWAAWRIYKIEKKRTGRGDKLFLERVFQKLLLNFTWWVNREDKDGNNIFQGGFLGMDNVGLFDRSRPLPAHEYLEQSDGTSWMAMYALDMFTIAVELAEGNPSYEDIASKFFQHFLDISRAMHHHGATDESLWDEADGFYYDSLHLSDDHHVRLRVQSLVGLIPLFAVTTLEPAALARLPNFARRMEWFLTKRPDLAAEVTSRGRGGVGERKLLALVTPDRLRRILARLLDEKQFLSPHGIRSLSRLYWEHPYHFQLDGWETSIDYEPAESTGGLFGGNSNWRGPVWMPVNYLLIEALQRFHHYLGDDFKVECPTGSGQMKNLWDVAAFISERLIGLFRRDTSGLRAIYGGTDKFQTDPLWKEYLLFNEYFHGDNGAGLGASHQTGWTALIAKLLQQRAKYGQPPRPGIMKP